MNVELRKATNVRNMPRRKYDRCKIPSDWSKYKNRRNIVTKLRRKSRAQYFTKQCQNGQDKNFWDAVKPLFNQKYKGTDIDLTLMENDKVVNEQIAVSNILNNYYVTVAETIGNVDSIDACTRLEDILQAHNNHDSVRYIKDNLRNNNEMTFSPVTTVLVYNMLKNLNCKKATGYDRIPPLKVQLAAEFLTKPILYLVNKSIESSCFPGMLKHAEVTPVYKKDDPMKKANYRPISVLPTLSKYLKAY